MVRKGDHIISFTFPIPQLTEIYGCVQSTVLSVRWTSASVRHQCTVFGSYWVRCSLLGPRMHPQIATALHQCSVSAPDPLFLSVSASHSLPVPDPAPPSHPAPWHPPTSRGAPAVVVVAHPLLLPFSTKLAPVEEWRRSSARATTSVDEQRARASNGGAVRAAAHPPAATVVPQFHRGTSCISFLLVPRCCITCCLCLYSI